MNILIVVNVLITMGSIICAMIWMVRHAKWKKTLKDKEEEKTKVYEVFQEVSMCYKKHEKDFNSFMDDFIENTTEHNKKRIEFELNELHKKLMDEYLFVKSQNEYLNERLFEIKLDKM